MRADIILPPIPAVPPDATARKALASKPSISSSNYLKRMSNFPGGQWSTIWDGLFWRFVHKHAEVFRKNPRLAVMTRNLDRMDPGRLRGHLETAETFLGKLFG